MSTDQTSGLMPNGDDHYISISSSFPKVRWRWSFFGDGTLVLQVTQDIPWWKRAMTRFFFGSRWERVNG